ncbi:MAG TPA: type III pantothenate kinase [Coriobacteriia bacterium]|jgi:type III pantothenate kinase
MILGVDIGNTQTVLGLFEGERLAEHWRVSTDASLTSDEIRIKIGGLLGTEDRSWAEVRRVVVSSVVPVLTLAYEEVAEKATGRPPMVVGPGLKTGVPIRYDDPREVGADRIVNAVAGLAEYGAPLVIVDFGTATTLDVLAADGAYVGGSIAPGVETSAEALFSHAAKLSKVDLEPPAHVIGKTTRESVQAGLLLGQAAMVDGLLRRTWDELGAETKVVATGGLAPRIAPLCATPMAIDVDLTLKGLVRVYAMNA